MKYNFFPLFATLAFMTLTLKSSAQQMPGMPSGGSAKFTIEKKGSKPVMYIFPNGFPAALKCVEHKGETAAETDTKIILTNDFDNPDGTETLVMVNMRIRPSGSGNFKLPINGDQAHLSVNIGRGNTTTSLLDASPEKGTGGNITIENYPTAVGKKIKGVFDATLQDQNDILYHVSGVFNVNQEKE